MHKRWDTLLESLKGTVLAQALEKLPKTERPWLTEVRARVGRPVVVRLGSKDYALGSTGLNGPSQSAEILSSDGVARLMQVLCAHSPYAYEESLRQGFLTLRGGHRAGVSGQAVLEAGEMRAFRHIVSVNIRVAREVVGCGDAVLAHIAQQRLRSTLVISPPGCGKTTLLRDLTRALGNCRRVALIDERGELAGCHAGVPGFDIGAMTDVIDGIPKAQGIPMMLRAMTPDVLVVDEIGRATDAAAVEEATASGVQIIASAHAATAEEALRKRILRELIGIGGFERIVVLSDRRGPGTLEEITDHTGRMLHRPSPWLKSVQDPIS